MFAIFCVRGMPALYVSYKSPLISLQGLLADVQSGAEVLEGLEDTHHCAGSARPHKSLPEDRILEFCHARVLTLTAHAEGALESVEAGGSLDEAAAAVGPREDARDILDETVGLGTLATAARQRSVRVLYLVTADRRREDGEERGDLGRVQDALGDGHGAEACAEACAGRAGCWRKRKRRKTAAGGMDGCESERASGGRRGRGSTQRPIGFEVS